MLLNVNTYANNVIESSFALIKFMEVLMHVYLPYSFNCWCKWMYLLCKWTAKGELGKRISLWYYCSGFSKIPFHGWAQVSRDKTFFSICKNFLDLGKILGLSTTFDLRENYLWIYELNQDLKLFSQFDNLFQKQLNV